MNTRKFIVPSFVILVVLYIVIWPLNLRSSILTVWYMDILPQRGTETVDELVKSYLTSVKEENSHDLQQLVPRTHSVNKKDIGLMITDMGGQTLEIDSVKTKIQDTEAVYMRKILLEGYYQDIDGANAEFTSTLYAQKLGERWYLILGKIKPALRSM